MMTLAFEQLASQNPSIGFVHYFPGLVQTGLFTNSFSGVLGFLFRWVISPLLTPFTLSLDEAGERGLFYATSEKYPSKEAGIEGAVEVSEGSNAEKGTGAYTLGWNGEPTPENRELLKNLRKKDAGEAVWMHTLEVFEHRSLA